MAKVLEKLRGEAAEIDADGDVVEGDLEDAAPKPKKKRKSEAADDAAKEEAGQKRKKHKSKEVRFLFPLDFTVIQLRLTA